MNSPPLTRFAWLSIWTALFTILLKMSAWWVTNSIGLLSDAMESLVNLIGAVVALIMLTVAAKPADEDHAYGHSKAEYFSSGVEGTLILIAALSIAVASSRRLLIPHTLTDMGLGVTISIAASLVNLGTALVLLRVARKHKSITLEANAQHLLTDVWTSVGIVTAIGLVAATDWHRIDPVIAMIVAANVAWTGTGIIRRSVAGLMDTALPADERERVHQILNGYSQSGVQFHALRTRQAGARRFVSMHVLVPGEWTVQRGHQLLERLEEEIRSALPQTSVFTHLESLEDPASWEDQKLERGS